MTADQLRQRIALLEQQKAQAVANANALNGAIQEAQYWLSELEKTKEG